MSSEVVQIIIDEENSGERLDSFLCESFPEFSRSKLQKFIKSELVKINSNKAKVATILKTGDVIDFDKPDEKIVIEPQDITLDIRYEDEDMLVVNKPKNMLTHPTVLETKDTLVNALLHKYGREGLSDINSEMRPGIVHRLDRNTSGLLLVAKNNKAHEILAQRIKEKTIKRNYLAVVGGNLDFETKIINAPIGRNPNNPIKMAVVEDGKPSVTHVKVLERFGGYTYVELELETGRTHQIRVHLSHLGHPIVNDTLYGGKKIGVKTTEQVLQAYKLTFNRLKDNIITTVTLDIDEDVKKVLNYLRSKG